MGKKILTNLEVKGYIDVDGGIKDSGGDMGNSGQYLQTNGSSDVNWATPPGASGNSTFVGKWSKAVTWGTDQTGVVFSGTNDENCTLTHNLGTSFVIVSVKDKLGSSGYSTNNMHMDIGNDAHVTVLTDDVIKLNVEPVGGSGYPDEDDQFLVTIIG
jgi:hypothetical protein